MNIVVEVLTEHTDLLALKGAWDCLAQEEPQALEGIDATGAFDWFETLRRAFPEAGDCRVVVARRGDEVLGLLPLVKTAQSRLGPVLGLITDQYCGRIAPLMKSADPQVWTALLRGADRAFPGWISLHMNLKAGHPSVRLALDEARQRGYDVQPGESLESPYFPLRASADEFKAGISKSVLQMLRTARNKFAKLGPIEFREYTRPEQAQELIELVLAVERQSWKHEAGTAITRQPRQEAFYRALFPHALETGLLYAAALWHEGRPIAHIFGTMRQQVFCCLKHSHCAEFDKLSPSYLLNDYAFGRLRDLGMISFDFMGRSEPHKLRWSDRNGSYVCQGLRLFNRTPKARLAGYIRRWHARLRSTDQKTKEEAAHHDE
ncbi:GNAT family N-acetyltransferase [Pelomonas sp. SE-A7]|uniref:GNAT family N-acetyltransferase n=1 Tax=Pelomonas sp. SE-A7 TaxID=3054953 RepID=UPI00259D068C|nr:GNAT family N-acetyltransferase [Pelomonas sp. SE-A7]MDM4764900.1 GNAT family N-acetyltransferase [Pelomonas sp. SE-A7]